MTCQTFVGTVAPLLLFQVTFMAMTNMPICHGWTSTTKTVTTPWVAWTSSSIGSRSGIPGIGSRSPLVPCFRRSDSHAITNGGAGGGAGAGRLRRHSTELHESLFSSILNDHTQQGIRKKATKHAAGKHILKGKVSAFVAKFLIAPHQWWIILRTVGKHLLQDWGDMVLIGLAWKGMLPLARWVYQKRNGWEYDTPDKLWKAFDQSRTRHVATFIAEIGALSAILYTVDVGLLFLQLLKFDFVTKYPIETILAGSIFSIYGARRLSLLKKHILEKRLAAKEGSTQWINRFIDWIIYTATALAVLDFLSIETGFALKSLFGLSGIGTLVFTLASQSLVSEFLSSLAIQSTNLYQPGDKIWLDDGTVGHVQNMGWLNTMVRRSDELVVRIPNTQIAGRQIANISRTRLSSVKQTLAVRYQDMDKLTQLCDDIRREIQITAMQRRLPLILDGSRPFRVVWRDYKDTHLEVFVLCFFRLKPRGDDYYDAQEQVLQAIARAMEKNGCEFSYTDFISPASQEQEDVYGGMEY